jgi:putative endonuclease
MDSNSIGVLGETYVCDLITEHGYKILSRNFRPKNFSEIDIIASKSKSILFIEVKTRTDFELNEQYKSVNESKIRKINRGISIFLRQNPQFYDFSCQIKIAIVLINPYNKAPKVVFYNYLD